MSLAKKIENLYKLLADDRLGALGLFHIANGKLVTPLEEDIMALFDYRSKRADEFVEWPVVEDLVSAIKGSKGYTGINHVGFCYKVASRQNEVKRIVATAGEGGHHVYQEPSNDDAAWLFVGDIAEVTNPLLEFLPHEGKINDKWVDYWLPHIQFDVDTGLPPNEIESLVKRLVGRPSTPYPIQIDGVTYIERVNLGCMDGVNVMLDLATNNRNISYRKTWSKLA